MRYSKQREAVYNTVAATKTHPDAAYVYQQVRNQIPNISLGTVYRNLQELCALGKLCKITVSDSSERYDACLHSHAHFVCNCCGSVSDLPNDTVTVNHNVECVQKVQIVLYGVCKNCCSN